jgi:hypothetical protein
VGPTTLAPSFPQPWYWILAFSFNLILSSFRLRKALEYPQRSKMASKDSKEDKDALDALELEAKEFDKVSLR